VWLPAASRLFACVHISKPIRSVTRYRRKGDRLPGFPFKSCSPTRFLGRWIARDYRLTIAEALMPLPWYRALWLYTLACSAHSCTLRMRTKLPSVQGHVSARASSARTKESGGGITFISSGDSYPWILITIGTCDHAAPPPETWIGTGWLRPLRLLFLQAPPSTSSDLSFPDWKKDPKDLI